MGELLGRLVTGAMWGAAAGAAVIFGKEGGAGLRTAAKTVMKGYVAAEEKVSEVRDSLEDVYAEARGGTTTESRPASKRVPIERESSAPQSSTPEERPGGNGTNGQHSGNGKSHAKTQRSRTRT